MESNLVPSLRETLFSPAISDMSDRIADIAELGIDSVLQEGLLKDIPVLGTILSLCKTGVNLRERNLIRQTAVFINAFKQGTISDEQLHKYRQELEDNPKKAEKEMGRVILLLDRMIEEQQSRMLGRFYCAYIKGTIGWDKFVELSEVNARMFISDYSELDSIARNPVGNDEKVSDHRMYRIQRLQSLGLVMDHRNRTRNRKKITSENNDACYVTTPLGGTFYNLMKRDV